MFSRDAVRGEAVRSTLPDVHADCVGVETSDTFWIDTSTPPPGGVFFYLVRALAPNVGSWGQDSEGNERTNVCSE